MPATRRTSPGLSSHTTSHESSVDDPSGLANRAECPRTSTSSADIDRNLVAATSRADPSAELTMTWRDGRALAIRALGTRVHDEAVVRADAPSDPHPGVDDPEPLHPSGGSASVTSPPSTATRPTMSRTVASSTPSATRIPTCSATVVEAVRDRVTRPGRRPHVLRRCRSIGGPRRPSSACSASGVVSVVDQDGELGRSGSAPNRVRRNDGATDPSPPQLRPTRW